MQIIILLVLLSFSALFSGLTLALMGLDVYTLKRKVETGDVRAAVIYPIRKKGNYLLTTLLLGNVAVNSALAIVLAGVAGGVVAGVVSTVLIFVFGEVIPQAAMSRYAMEFGVKAAPFVKFIMVLFYPIAKPVSWLLDKFLGEELPTHFSKQELMRLISEHEGSLDSAIDVDEERIIHGALLFSNKTVRQVMTPRSVVEFLDAEEILTKGKREEVSDFGYSRYPVYSEKKDNVVGILHIRELVSVSRDVRVGDIMSVNFLSVDVDEMLDIVFDHMLTRKQHMATVFNEFGTLLGVITLEDILEEVIQREIMDENDSIVDLRAEARRRAKKLGTKFITKKQP